MKDQPRVKTELAIYQLWARDIAMPEEDGDRLIRHLRSLPIAEGGGIPALALTAYARVGDREALLRPGFQRHVPKPIDPGQLASVIADLVQATSLQ